MVRLMVIDVIASILHCEVNREVGGKTSVEKLLSRTSIDCKVGGNVSHEVVGKMIREVGDNISAKEVFVKGVSMIPLLCLPTLGYLWKPEGCT